MRKVNVQKKKELNEPNCYFIIVDKMIAKYIKKIYIFLLQMACFHGLPNIHAFFNILCNINKVTSFLIRIEYFLNYSKY